MPITVEWESQLCLTMVNAVNSINNVARKRTQWSGIINSLQTGLKTLVSILTKLIDLVYREI